MAGGHAPILKGARASCPPEPGRLLHIAEHKKSDGRISRRCNSKQSVILVCFYCLEKLFDCRDDVTVMGQEGVFQGIGLGSDAVLCADAQHRGVE